MSIMMKVLFIGVSTLAGDAEMKAQQLSVTPTPQPSTAKSQRSVIIPPQRFSITVGGGIGRERTPPLTERERMLLERIEQLERRLIEVESRVGLTASAGRGTAEAVAPATQPSLTSAPQPEAATAVGTVTSESQPASASTAPARQQDQEAWDKGGVKILPYGFLVASAAYNTYAMIPGSIGFFGVPITGALVTAVQTFQVSDEVLGFGKDVPDCQLRFAIGHGKANPRSLKRPFELGISGHIGQRRGLLVSALFERDFTTWSGNIDLSANLGGKAKVSGELFIGSILGDYKAGILHTFNPLRNRGVRAAGGWAELQLE
jgi:hypothetical protein